MSILEEVKDYWDLRSNGFSESVRYEMEKSGERVLNRLREHIGTEPKDVLDIGCGPGLYSILLAKDGHRVTGIDYSPKMVGHAIENAGSEGVSSDFRVMDAQNLSFPDGSFDCIVSRNVLWNLEHPERAYAEMLRVLRPRGIGIISDGNFYLHLYDREYSELRENFKRESSERDEGSHSHFNKDNVDFGIIEELAKDMPLSRERRPQWDVDTLCRLGCDDISVRIWRGVPRKTDLVMSFEVVFRRPSDD